MINNIQPGLKLGLVFLPVVLLACASQGPQQGLKWRTQLDGGCAAGSRAASMPVLIDGVIYVGSSDGAVYAIGANSGEKLWRFQTGAGLASGTGITVAPSDSSAADMLGTALERSKAYAVGGKRQITATPVYDNNSIYIGSWDHNFYAVDAMTGNAKWAFATEYPVMDKALIYRDKVIFVTGGRLAQNDSGDGLVYALDAATGISAWIFNTVPDVDAKRKSPSQLPVVKGDVVYITNWNFTRYEGFPDNAVVYVHAVDGSSGKARWSTKISAAWPSPPIVTDKYVLFQASTRDLNNSLYLYALDRETGQEKWTYKTAGGRNYWQFSGDPTPQIADGNIVILTTDIAVIGLDLDTGTERWQVTEPFEKKPINEGRLGPLMYVLTGDTLQPTVGVLYALDPRTGEIRWSQSMYSRNGIRAVIDDVVYFSTGILRTALFTIDGDTGAELGTAWSLGVGAFTNESSGICAGPVRYGEQILVSTEMQQVAGTGSSRGYLYSVKVPAKISAKTARN